MAETTDEVELSPVEAFIAETREQLVALERQIKEIGLLVEQSQGEVDKLAQRNTGAAGNLHQLQAHFDTVPREDIKDAYEAAMDTQQRLFTMRGQLEKLQSDQRHLKTFTDYAGRTLALLEGGAQPMAGAKGPVARIGFEEIIEAQEDERRRISRQIHDGPAQALSNFILQVEIALRLFSIDQEQAKQELNALKASANATFANVRDFIWDLRPMMLDDLGLVPTVRRYIDAFKDKTGLDVAIVVTGSERRLESHREVLVFRAVQSLLANIREHAQATSAKVTVDLDANQIRVSVEDNGQGMDTEVVLAEEAPGRGLKRLVERIEQAGGDVEIESKPGGGTRIAFALPTD